MSQHPWWTSVSPTVLLLMKVPELPRLLENMSVYFLTVWATLPVTPEMKRASRCLTSCVNCFRRYLITTPTKRTCSLRLQVWDGSRTWRPVGSPSMTCLNCSWRYSLTSSLSWQGLWRPRPPKPIQPHYWACFSIWKGAISSILSLLLMLMVFKLRNLCYYLEADWTDLAFKCGARIDAFVAMFPNGEMKPLKWAAHNASKFILCVIYYYLFVNIIWLATYHIKITGYWRGYEACWGGR